MSKHHDDTDSEDEGNEAILKGEEAVPEEEQEVTDLSNSDVITKYQEAAKIVQAALQEISNLCVEGARLLDICNAGDAFIEQRTHAIFRGKNKAGKPIERGLAFPVCISVNEVVCHYTPLTSEDKLPPLANGDLVKIDLGAHIDGYIAVGAHTLVVGGLTEDMKTGLRADVMVAAWRAADVASRLIKNGNTNAMVTEAIKRIAEAYNVRAISGTVMHEMKRFVIDGKKVILLREEEGNKVDPCTFETCEVFSIDIAMSTGDGKPRQSELRTTVFKRNVANKFGLKVKASRLFFNEVNKKYPTLPFSTRYLGDETAVKMGLRECVAHDLLASYPVLMERSGDQVAHVKYTVLLLPNGTVKVTGLLPPEGLNSDKVLPEDLQAILDAEDSKSSKKAKKRNAKKAAAKTETA